MSMFKRSPLLLLFFLFSIIFFLLHIVFSRLSVVESQAYPVNTSSHLNGLEQIFLLFGCLFSIYTIYSFFFNTGRVLSRNNCSLFVTKARSFASNAARSINHIFNQDQIFKNLLPLIMFIVGISVRSYFLNQTIRYDEAFTYLNFVDGKFMDTFKYPLPNNHVLHSLLIRIVVSIWNPSPPIIRLPAFFFGIFSIPLAYLVTRKVINENSGILTAFFMSIYPILILYSTNARGYSLVIFLTLVLILLGVQYLKHPNSLVCMAMAAISSFGLFTIPTMLFPIAGIYFYIFCLLFIKYRLRTRKIIIDYAMRIVLLTISLTTLLYSPVIYVSNGIESIIDNKFVTPQPLDSFLAGLIPHFIHSVKVLTMDIPMLVVILSMLLVPVGFYRLSKKKNWEAILLLPSMILLSLVILLLQHKIPFPRTWLFFIPVVLIYVDAGFTQLHEHIHQNFQKAIKLLLVAVIIFYSISLTTNNKTIISGTFPEAPVISVFLKDFVDNNDSIVAPFPADQQMRYYAKYYDLPIGISKDMVEPSTSGNVYFVVKDEWYTIKDITDKPVTLIFKYNDALVYSLENQ